MVRFQSIDFILPKKKKPQYNLIFANQKEKYILVFG